MQAGSKFAISKRKQKLQKHSTKTWAYVPVLMYNGKLLVKESLVGLSQASDSTVANHCHASALAGLQLYNQCTSRSIFY